MTGLVLDHLWQSTLFAAGAWLLTRALRNNGAQIRFWVWFAASIKFLIPFAALTAFGGYLPMPGAAKISAPAIFLMQAAAQPFSTPMPLLSAPAVSAAPHLDSISLVVLLWALGFCAIAARWARRQLQLRQLLRDALDLPLLAPVPVKSAASRLEPGLVGIWRPVILLPHGIAAHLSADELDAIMAHELCHLRRRDNLLAAIHMFVEALFWFHPLVWWLGKRMIEERERACDESVLASGKPPKIYAESILKVCKLYLHSPLTCAAGVAGADLKQRLEEIVENKISCRLKNTKKALLAAAALLAIGAPVALGLIQAPLAHAQTNVSASKKDMADSDRYAGPMLNRVKLMLAHDAAGGTLAMTLSSDAFIKSQTGIQYRGNVALSIPSGIATADAAVWNRASQTLTLDGNVVLFAGGMPKNGKQLVFSMRTGVIRMNGENVNSGFPGGQVPGPDRRGAADSLLFQADK